MKGAGQPAAERLAERIRKECLRVAEDAYEDAGIRGLCAEGRWEAAVDALRTLDVAVILEQLGGDAEPPRLGSPPTPDEHAG